MAAQNQPKISPGQPLHRSISTPAPASARVGGIQQQQVQMNPAVESQQAHRPLTASGNPNQRVGLSRSLSRTEQVKE